MAGLAYKVRLNCSPQNPISPTPRPLFGFVKLRIAKGRFGFSSPLSPKSQTLRTTRLIALAKKNGDDEESKNEVDTAGSDGGDAAEGKGKGGWRLWEGIRWSDLVVSSDPDNIVAVGLTGLLTWASVQVLWQLVIISLAILVAAVKYSFIAALLIFILITLL